MLLWPAAMRAQEDVRDAFASFTESARGRYSDFRRSCNDDYIDFLKRSWEYFQLMPGIPRPQEDDVPPVVIDKDEPVVHDDKEIVFDEVVPVPEVTPRPEPIPQIQPRIKPEPVAPVRPEIDPKPLAPVRPEHDPELEPGPENEPEPGPENEPEPGPEPEPEPQPHTDVLGFDFYGTHLTVRTPQQYKIALNSTNRISVARSWRHLSGGDYDAMLADCLEIRDRCSLCDWAYLEMLQCLAGSYAKNQNEAVLLTAYLFSQSGYKMRLGQVGNELALLFGTKHQIYGRSSLLIDGCYFYPMNHPCTSIHLANFSFPNERPLSLQVNVQPSLAVARTDLRQLSSSIFKTTLTCSVNKNLLDFMGNIPSSQLDGNPLTRWAMYANAPLDPLVSRLLYPALGEAIGGKDKAEAVAILLDFVQSAFVYGYDDKIWGADRAFFSEESLFYPYCDCEDRAILFSRLVKDLAALDVVLVYYPGHLATAVNFGQTQVHGDYIMIGGDKYYICDPTFIGAPVGMTMPKMDNTKAKVILLAR